MQVKINKIFSTHMKLKQVHYQGVSNGRQLGGNNGQHGDVDSVELIEASPGSALTQPREDLSNSLEFTKRHIGNSLHRPMHFGIKLHTNTDHIVQH